MLANKYMYRYVGHVVSAIEKSDLDFWAVNALARDEVHHSAWCSLDAPHLVRLLWICRGRPRPCSRRRLPAVGSVFVFSTKLSKRLSVRIGTYQSRSTCTRNTGASRQVTVREIRGSVVRISGRFLKLFLCANFTLFWGCHVFCYQCKGMYDDEWDVVWAIEKSVIYNIYMLTERCCRCCSVCCFTAIVAACCSSDAVSYCCSSSCAGWPNLVLVYWIWSQCFLSLHSNAIFFLPTPWQYCVAFSLDWPTSSVIAGMRGAKAGVNPPRRISPFTLSVIMRYVIR